MITKHTLKASRVFLLVLVMFYICSTAVFATDIRESKVAEIHLGKHKADILIKKPYTEFSFQGDYLIKNNRTLLTNNDITNLLNYINTDIHVSYSTCQDSIWPGASIEKNRDNNWEQYLSFTDGYSFCSIDYSQKENETCYGIEPAIWISKYNNISIHLLEEWDKLNQQSQNALSDGQCFLPLRFTLEKFGYSLNYSKGIITIYTTK